MRKSTNKELVQLLESRNTEGKYSEIIEKAKANVYHDYKSDEVMPKLVLHSDLSKFPELKDIDQDVINGAYDEEADEADKEMMRKDFLEMGENEEMLKAIGL